MSDVEATVFSIQQFSTEDGPGLRTTVFFKGCPMRCPWCHNPESIAPQPEVVWHGGRCLNDGGCVAVCPQGAVESGADGISVARGRCTGCGDCVAYCPASALEMHGTRMTAKDIHDRVVRDAAFYEESGGGVTLSGGEPLAQPAAALGLMRLLRESGIHVALDTCGVAGEGVLGEAVGLADLVLLDLKTANPANHEAWTGVALDRVDKAARLLTEAAVPLWVRTPVVPGYTATENEIAGVARFVAEALPHAERHDLLAYSNLCTAKYAQLGRPFALDGVPLLFPETMERLCEVARASGSMHARWSGPTRVAEAAAS
ncbi:MAG: glycyl-radical enzyme activating protein [Nitrospiraceae bacterium]|nr:glycyl-radical enzyme activating protein [Nitrospiraceae bacterium]